MSKIAEKEMINKLKSDFVNVVNITEQIRLGNYDMKLGVSKLDEILNTDIRYMEDRIVEISTVEEEVVRLNSLVAELNKTIEEKEREIEKLKVAEVAETNLVGLDDIFNRGIATLGADDVLEIDTDKWEVKFNLKQP